MSLMGFNTEPNHNHHARAYAAASDGLVREPPMRVAHIVYRFDMGGLENGLVNLINHLPADEYEHLIICLTDYNPSFAKRIQRSDVQLHALNKAPGKDPRFYVRLWRLLRQTKPNIVHTRNLGTVDCLLIAAAAGVPIRIHGEHGWDVQDLHGTNWKYRWLRRATIPVTHRYIVVSQELGRWLHGVVKIPQKRIVHIVNGVDTQKFLPATEQRDDGVFVIGYAGRFVAVKNPLMLVDAFIDLLQQQPKLKGRVRLLMLGDGELWATAVARLQEAELGHYAELPGRTDDVAQRLKQADLFVLPSRNEGISNTILEAMASGLPVVATQVGGNPELVAAHETGLLVPAENSSALAEALLCYIQDPAMAQAHGRAARRRAEALFSLRGMVAAYGAIYKTAMSGVTGNRT